MQQEAAKEAKNEWDSLHIVKERNVYDQSGGVETSKIHIYILIFKLFKPSQHIHQLNKTSFHINEIQYMNFI